MANRTPTPPTATPGYHRFAVALALCVLGLISAGAFVTSTGSGLSVPDWPLSYGTLNPPNWWTISTVRAEHGHRLIAGTVAILTVLLAVWIQRREPRRWVRRLGWLAVAAVFAQALLGGLTVLFFLPTPISVGHAALAQAFLCLIVTLAVATSPAWWWRPALAPRAAAGLAPVATLVTAMVYLQILLGAVMRHSGAGLAIPDFPLAFGRLVPPSFDFPIAIHYSHRVGALMVTLAVAWAVGKVFGLPGAPGLKGLAGVMALIVALQVSLGALVVLTGKAVLPNTLHVATGAALLATSLVLSLRLWRLAHGARAASRPAGAGRLREAAS